MSIVPPSSAPLYVDITLYSMVQVAVTCVALYDHVLALGREVDLIWMRPMSLVTALYVIERYLGDVVLIGSLFCIRLFDFRAWGALVYAWATQATMQVRIYAMYRQSRRILILLLTTFFGEISAIAFIIWRSIGPNSHLRADSEFVLGGHVCIFSGISPKFVYLFIPFLCLETILFLLAVRVFIENMKRSSNSYEGKYRRLNSFMSVLARDSVCYFFVNLSACAVVAGLFQSVTTHYANICIPFVMLLEVLVGTRLILDFRERYALPDADAVASGRHSSLHFRAEDALETTDCQFETIVITEVVNC